MILRPATEADVPFVAWTVLTALDLSTDDLDRAVAACRRDDTLYSYLHALIAEQDGRPVGCLVSYPGEEYADRRSRTWQMIWGEADSADAVDYDHVAVETFPGEYYLDSMAISPEYRGQGVGHKLMQTAMSQHEAARYALIVSVEKPHLQAYYAQLGFRPSGEIDFFGHIYRRMIYDSLYC